MLEAPTLDNVLAHRNRRDGAACCIVLAPAFTTVGAEYVIPRIGYFNCRSDMQVHFYCAGYGGYGTKQDVPDMQTIGVVKYEDTTEIPWWFSQRLFAGFVDELERTTTWKYSGESELILLGPEVDFSKVLHFNIIPMLDDGIITSPAGLLESIIQYTRSAHGKPSAYNFSDRQGIKLLKEGTIDTVLTVLPKPARGVWEKGRHYAVRNIQP